MDQEKHLGHRELSNSVEHDPHLDHSGHDHGSGGEHLDYDSDGEHGRHGGKGKGGFRRFFGVPGKGKTKSFFHDW